MIPNGSGLMSRVSYLVLFVCALTVGCGSGEISVPCPKPPSYLDPAPAETVSVGDSAYFWIPSNVDLSKRVFLWSTTPSNVAVVASNADPKRAKVWSVKRGTAQVTAVDLNSPSNCRDEWEGELVVR